MLNFNQYLEEKKKKKETVKINPSKEDLYEKDAKGEDCTGSDHTKSEKKRRKEDVNDGPDVQNEAMSSYDKNRKAAAKRAAARNAARAAGKTGAVPGVGYVTPRREKETYTDEKGTVRHKSGAKNEEVENLDELTAKERENRDAGAIAKKKMRNKEHKKYVNFLDVDESKGYQPEITHSKMGDAKKAADKRRKKAADSLPPHLRLDVMRKAFAHTNEGRLTGANDMQSKLYAANNKSGKKMTDDEIKQEKGGKEFLDRLKAAKSKMKNEGVADRARKAVDHQRKGTHGDDHELDSEMKKTQKSVDKLNKVGERLRADNAAKKVEKSVKKMTKVKSPQMSEGAELKKANINYKTTKKDGKTTYHVNKNDEADAQAAMKNDPKYILGKTRVKPVKESAPLGKSDGKPANTNEEHAYDSAEESAKEIQKEISEKTFNALKDTLVDNAFSIYEATRYKKEKGYDKGGTKKPAPKAKDAKPTAMDVVRAQIIKKYGKGAIANTSGSKQQKKVKGAKSTTGTGKYKKAADAKKQTSADAKKRGFKSTQNYVDTMARYGGKDNYDKGKGLGT